MDYCPDNNLVASSFVSLLYRHADVQHHIDFTSKADLITSLNKRDYFNPLSSAVPLAEAVTFRYFLEMFDSPENQMILNEDPELAEHTQSVVDLHYDVGVNLGLNNSLLRKVKHGDIITFSATPHKDIKQFYLVVDMKKVSNKFIVKDFDKSRVLNAQSVFNDCVLFGISKDEMPNFEGGS